MRSHGALLCARTSVADALDHDRGTSPPFVPFVTFDLRQAQAARSLGFTVLGA